MKTSELQGAALDWAVAKCEGVELHGGPILNGPSGKWVIKVYDDSPYGVRSEHWLPSTNWAQGGPIIERELIAYEILEDQETFSAYYPFRQGLDDGLGPTVLTAAMRCYVASKLGDEIEIPEELL